MSVIALKKKIFEDFMPRLDQALKSDEKQALYDIVPEMQDFFNCSCELSEHVGDFIEHYAKAPEALNLQSNIAESTQIMEIIARKHFVDYLKSCANDQEKILFIQKMGIPDTDFNCRMLNFERLPELFEERKAASIDEKSRVLILGTGSISITGLYFASCGARVSLLDRDPRALQNFMPVYEALPLEMQRRIEFLPIIDARDYDYRANEHSHIFMAALLSPKEPIMRSIYNSYHGSKSDSSPTLLVRVPRKDLMQLFYYGLDHASLEEFKTLSKVDLGFEKQTSVTFILSIKR